MNGYQIICECLSVGHIPENWDIYQLGPKTAERYKSKNKYDWVMYAGGNDWEPNYKYISVYTQKKYNKQGETNRIWIRVKYPSDLKEGSKDSSDKQKLQTEFGQQVANLWIKIAKRLRTEHIRQHSEYMNVLDSENKKLDKARNKGFEYERKLPDVYPKYDGNWGDAFALALKDKQLKALVAEYGIDTTDWIVNKTSMEEYGFDVTK